MRFILLVILLLNKALSGRLGTGISGRERIGIGGRFMQEYANEIRTALKNGNKIEKVTVKFDRSNAANIRPNSLVVEYNIDGVNLRKTFENKSSK